MLTSLVVSNASAGSFGLGVTLSSMNIEASGKESSNTKGSEADTSVQSKTVDNDVTVGGFYAEYTTDAGATIGYEATPGSSDVSSKFTRTDTETSVTDDLSTNSDSRLFSAKAEIEDYSNMYIEIPVYGNFYTKLGYSTLDVVTKEIASGNGGSYGNTSLDGFNYGVGYKMRDLGVSGSVVKLAYEATNFEQLSLKSTGNSVAAEVNTVTADLDTWALKLSVGYAF
jgi:hypothetical protein